MDFFISELPEYYSLMTSFQALVDSDLAVTCETSKIMYHININSI